MIIGVDLDDVLYGYPFFFAEFIRAMIARGHTFVCTSGHSREEWEESDRDRLTKLGIDPDSISPHLLRRKADIKYHGSGPAWKARAASKCDIVFDDDGAAIQGMTKTPIFMPPKVKR